MVPSKALEASSTGTNRAAEGEIEVTHLIGVQVEAEGVETAGQVPIVVKVFIEVSFIITVEIVKASDLIVGHGIYDIVHNLKPQGFV